MWFVNNRFACATGVSRRIRKPDNPNNIESERDGAVVPYAFLSIWMR